MTIIEELKRYEKNQLDDWFNLSEKDQKRFCKDLIKFSNKHPDKLKAYCINTLPSEYSSLSIVYEALSEYSTEWNEFLCEEIKRVVILAREKRIKPKYLEILTDIECEDIFSKTEEVYIEILNFLTSELRVNNDDKFNEELLEIIDWYLIEYDEEDDILEAEVWVERVKALAEEGTPKVKVKARSLLKDMDPDLRFKAMSFMENLKLFFK